MSKPACLPVLGLSHAGLVRRGHHNYVLPLMLLRLVSLITEVRSPGLGADMSGPGGFSLVLVGTVMACSYLKAFLRGFALRRPQIRVRRREPLLRFALQVLALLVLVGFHRCQWLSRENFPPTPSSKTERSPLFRKRSFSDGFSEALTDGYRVKLGSNWSFGAGLVDGQHVSERTGPVSFRPSSAFAGGFFGLVLATGLAVASAPGVSWPSCGCSFKIDHVRPGFEARTVVLSERIRATSSKNIEGRSRF